MKLAAGRLVAAQPRDALARPLSSLVSPPNGARSTKAAPSGLGMQGGVHGSRGPASKQWRNKPLFRRTGDVRFKTGLEACEILVAEAGRRDQHKSEYMSSLQATIFSLAPIFDRMPKYAWIAKLLLEPERSFQFRVAWLDDAGIMRVNRGQRVQYSSALGPYEGPTHFHHTMSSSFIKAAGIDATISHALSGTGAAVGGSDFNTVDKSEAEIQRFCQSYMTELSKYIGPEHDNPSMGIGCGDAEVGYLYGQYKRVNPTFSSKGTGVLWGGTMPFSQAYGYGVVAFAEEMLKDKGDSLAGKRCLVTGSGKVALAVAAKLLEKGAIPLTLSDSSGYVLEPDGITPAKLANIAKIKAERGARIGRFIVASTTARYLESETLWEQPCDLVFPCALSNQIDGAAAETLASGGCKGVIEGAHAPCTADAIKIFKQNGMHFAPHKATMACGGFLGGHTLERAPIATLEELDARLAGETARMFSEIKATANEFNARGDLRVATDIAGFLRVGNAMLAHGAV